MLKNSYRNISSTGYNYGISNLGLPVPNSLIDLGEGLYIPGPGPRELVKYEPKLGPPSSLCEAIVTLLESFCVVFETKSGEDGFAIVVIIVDEQEHFLSQF